MRDINNFVYYNLLNANVLSLMVSYDDDFSHKCTETVFRGEPSGMLNDLNWPSLHFRRRINRLQMFYKAIYNLSPLTIPSYFTAVQRLTRHFHPLHFVIPSTRTTAHQQSYFPRTIDSLERVQRRATKFILSDYTSNYKTRLMQLGMLPLMQIRI